MWVERTVFESKLGLVYTEELLSDMWGDACMPNCLLFVGITTCWWTRDCHRSFVIAHPPSLLVDTCLYLCVTRSKAKRKFLSRQTAFL